MQGRLDNSVGNNLWLSLQKSVVIMTKVLRDSRCQLLLETMLTDYLRMQVQPNTKQSAGSDERIILPTDSSRPYDINEAIGT